MFKLLIVDDEEMITAGLKQMIERLDLPGISDISTASSGSEAIVKAGENKPDIVLTDLNMPEMDGHALIAELQYSVPEALFIVISGYDDFQLVRKSFKLGISDYLLKPVHSDDLRGSLHKAIQNLDAAHTASAEHEITRRMAQLDRLSRGMNRVLHGPAPSGEAYAAVFRELNLEWPYSYSCAAVLFRPNASPAALLDEIAPWHNPSGCLLVYPFYNLQSDFIVWFHYREPSGQNVIRSLLEQWAAGKTPADGSGGIAALGTAADGISGLPEAYRTALETMKYKMTAPSGSLLLYEDTARRKPVLLDAADLRQFADVVGMGRKEQASELVHRQFHDDILRGAAIDSIRKNAEAVCRTIGWDGDIAQQLHRLDNTEQLRLYLISCLIQTIEARTRMLSSCNVVEVAKKYVQEHLLSDISMAVAANYCNVSYSYFSKVFKDETGINFQDYVIMMRMEYARQALSRPHAKVQDVALALRYSNPKNFTRVFKSYYGFSPKEYQKMNRASLRS